MSNVQKALDHAKDQSTTKLGLTFNGKSVGGGEQVPRAGTYEHLSSMKTNSHHTNNTPQKLNHRLLSPSPTPMVYT